MAVTKPGCLDGDARSRWIGESGLGARLLDVGAARQSMLSADLGLTPPALIVITFQHQLRDFPGALVLADADEHQVGGGDMVIGIGSVIPPLSSDLHPDLHGGAADPVDLGASGQDVPDSDRLHEDHLVHGRGDRRRAAVSRRTGPGCIVDGFHDDAAVHVPVQIGIAVIHDPSQRDARIRRRFRREAAHGAPSCQPVIPPVLRDLVGSLWPAGHHRVAAAPAGQRRSDRAITRRWIWFVPS
ncbi:MAG: hypothetical protein V9E98_06820 [Candidatus Nanopelagicales bacterium]